MHQTIFSIHQSNERSTDIGTEERKIIRTARLGVKPRVSGNADHSLAAKLKNALLFKVSGPIELTDVSERNPNGKDPLITMVLTIFT